MSVPIADGKRKIRVDAPCARATCAQCASSSVLAGRRLAPIREKDDGRTGVSHLKASSKRGCPARPKSQCTEGFSVLIEITRLVAIGAASHPRNLEERPSLRREPDDG